MTGKTQRRLAVAVVVVGLAGGGATYAAAAGGNGGGPPGGHGFAEAAASYLGLTAAELRAQLESGRSLAQIATAEGKSVSGLEEAIYAAAKADLDKAVAAGRITAAQEATMLADLKSHIDDLVTRPGPPGPPPARV